VCDTYADLSTPGPAWGELFEAQYLGRPETGDPHSARWRRGHRRHTEVADSAAVELLMTTLP